MWEVISSWNWELTIALGALGLSGYTFYEQNVKKELVIYPYEKDKVLYITIENTGKGLIRDYTIQLANMENMPETAGKYLSKMHLFQRKAKFSLSANKINRFTAISTSAFAPEEYFPILTFDVYNNKGRKVDRFVCDFNVYRYQLSIVRTTIKENKKNKLVQEISNSLNGIHNEIAKRNNTK